MPKMCVGLLQATEADMAEYDGSVVRCPWADRCASTIIDDKRQGSVLRTTQYVLMGT